MILNTEARKPFAKRSGRWKTRRRVSAVSIATCEYSSWPSRWPEGFGFHPEMASGDIHTVTSAKFRPSLKDIQSAGMQAGALTRQLLTFTRRDVATPEVLDPNTIVAKMKRMLQRLLGEHIGLKVETINASRMVYGDPGQVELIILNIAINAADAMPEGGLHHRYSRAA